MKDTSDYPRRRSGVTGQAQRAHHRRRQAGRRPSYAGATFGYALHRQVKRLVEGPTFRPTIGMIYAHTIRIFGSFRRGERPFGRRLTWRQRGRLMHCLGEEVTA